MAVYLAMVFAAKWGLDFTENSILRHLMAVAPVIPAIVAAWALIVYVRTLDEVQRAIMAESAIISFLVVGFGSLTYGFLEAFLNYPPIAISWVLPALSVAFGLSAFFVRRKYL